MLINICISFLPAFRISHLKYMKIWNGLTFIRHSWIVLLKNSLRFVRDIFLKLLMSMKNRFPSIYVNYFFIGKINRRITIFFPFAIHRSTQFFLIPNQQIIHCPFRIYKNCTFYVLSYSLLMQCHHFISSYINWISI